MSSVESGRAPILQTQEWFRRAGVIPVSSAVDRVHRLYPASSHTLPLGKLLGTHIDKRAHHQSPARTTPSDIYREVSLPKSPPPAFIRKSENVARLDSAPLLPAKVPMSVTVPVMSDTRTNTSALIDPRPSDDSQSVATYLLSQSQASLPFRVRTRTPSTAQRSSPAAKPMSRSVSTPSLPNHSIVPPTELLSPERNVFAEDVNRWLHKGFHFNGATRFRSESRDLTQAGTMYDHWQTNTISNVDKCPQRYSAAFDSKVLRKIEGIPDGTLISTQCNDLSLSFLTVFVRQLPRLSRIQTKFGSIRNSIDITNWCSKLIIPNGAHLNLSIDQFLPLLLFDRSLCLHRVPLLHELIEIELMIVL
jgi:hypothetical protein